VTFEPIKLKDELIPALEQISSYLRTVRLGLDRAVKQEGFEVGYWQTIDWLSGLLEIAGECDRLIVNHTMITTAEPPHAQKGDS